MGMGPLPQKRDFLNAWPEGIPIRSRPYREGMQVGYTRAMQPKHERAPFMPERDIGYPEGSVEFDAWWAGHDAGQTVAQVDLDAVYSDDAF